MSFIITFIRKFLPSNPNYTESDSNNNQITAIKNNNDTAEREASKLEWSVERVLSSGKMLTDNEIYAAVKTLKQQFGGNIKGLYDPQSMNAKRLRKAQFYVQYPERFVQILHDGSLHWFTLSNLRSTKAHQIQSYDSLFVDSTYVHNKMLQTSLKKVVNLFNKDTMMFLFNKISQISQSFLCLYRTTNRNCVIFMSNAQLSRCKSKATRQCVASLRSLLPSICAEEMIRLTESMTRRE